MKRRDLWKLSLLNVFSAPVRSLLTVLGFAIGVASVLAVLTLGEAGRVQVEDEMNRLGISKIWLTPSEGSYLHAGTGEWLARTMDADAQEVIYLPVQSGGAGTLTAIACEQTYLNGVQLIEGRMLWSREWSADGQSALVGKKAADTHHIKPGNSINAAGRIFQIAGIISGNGNMNSTALENAVVLPIEAAVSLTGGLVHEIQLSAATGRSIEQTQEWAQQMLDRRGQQADALNMQVQMDAASSVIFTFVNVLKWVALICILVGGIGVMNMMLVNVRERKREIGIMKSMGTTQGQICFLFLQEALMYAMIGGVLGILLGFGLIDAAGKSIQLDAKADLADCAAVIACALATGIFFGVVPAFRASKLSCVDALRQD